MQKQKELYILKNTSTRRGRYMLKKLIIFSVIMIFSLPAKAYKIQTYTPVQPYPYAYGVPPYGRAVPPFIPGRKFKNLKRKMFSPYRNYSAIPPLMPAYGTTNYYPSQTTINRTTSMLNPETRIPTIAPLQPVKEKENAVQTQTEKSAAQSPPATGSYPKISSLENTIFNRTYENQDIYDRLKRLEKKVFRRTFENMTLADRMDNILNNVDPAIVYNINQKELAKIENKILGRSFEYENIDERITRLEKEMLGAMQSGNIKQRYDVVKSAARHYNAYPVYTAQQQQNYNTYNNYKKPRRNILGFFFDMLSTGFGAGQMTGYTPPVFMPYDNFQDASGIQDYYMGNRGGHYLNRNMGSGSTVKILD